MDNQGAILIVSGPSGCGKSTLLNKLFEQLDNYYFSISTTTRPPRVGEQNGREYFFVSKEEFEKGITNNDFLEYAKVHDNYYGTSLKPIYQALQQGKLVVFDIDVQGHDLVREKVDKLTTSVFITTPSLQELKKRLQKRDTDDKSIIQKRIKNAQKEIKYIDRYDYLLINDDLEQTAKQLLYIANIARHKSSIINKKDFISSWLYDIIQ